MSSTVEQVRDRFWMEKWFVGVEMTDRIIVWVCREVPIEFLSKYIKEPFSIRRI